MKMFKFMIVLFSVICFPLTAQNNFATSVKSAVSRQLKSYPKSTLKDIYKNFFQDKYGPGHLIADTSKAGAYIRKELSSYSQIEGVIAEPTGREGNFYRVNLSVIKEGKIPYQMFFDAFVRSVNGITPMPIEEWREEWTETEKVITSMNLGLPDYEKDKKEIDNNLKEGNYVGHHSELFDKTYSPHYRIISKKIYEEELKPILEK